MAYEHGYHRWPPQPESDWTSSHLTQCGSIRRLLEMRNSHPVTCESPSGRWTKRREGRTGVWLYGYKTSQSPSGKSGRSNCESVCGAGGMKVYRVMERRDERLASGRWEDCFGSEWPSQLLVPFPQNLAALLSLYSWVQILNPPFLFWWFWEETAIKCSLTTQSERSRCVERRRVEWPPDPVGARNQGLSGPKCQSRVSQESTDITSAFTCLGNFSFLQPHGYFECMACFPFIRAPSFSPIKCIYYSSPLAF